MGIIEHVSNLLSERCCIAQQSRQPVDHCGSGCLRPYQIPGRAPRWQEDPAASSRQGCQQTVLEVPQRVNPQEVLETAPGWLARQQAKASPADSSDTLRYPTTISEEGGREGRASSGTRCGEPSAWSSSIRRGRGHGPVWGHDPIRGPFVVPNIPHSLLQRDTRSSA